MPREWSSGNPEANPLRYRVRISSDAHPETAFPNPTPLLEGFLKATPAAHEPLSNRQDVA
jgi:hypothetical protein